MKIDKKWWKSTKNGENRQKMVLLPSKMVLPPSKMVLLPSKMVLPQAMAWVQYWFRVLSLKFYGKSKKNCGNISQVSPAFCMYVRRPYLQQENIHKVPVSLEFSLAFGFEDQREIWICSKFWGIGRVHAKKTIVWVSVTWAWSYQKNSSRKWYCRARW